jgi:glycosyltransferase involved in cell wall biosynthesis
MIKYSIVVPIYNEEKNIDVLYQRLTKVLTALKKEYELIFVNDGSFDQTLFKLINLYQKDSRVKIINFSRNFGHQMAVSAGLKYAQGEIVVVMDADLQDPPEVLPQFFKRIEEGYDVVYAIRKKRKESLFMRLAYVTYYRFLKQLLRLIFL